MPELPEVEVLVRHLAPMLEGKTIRGVQVRRERVLWPTTEAGLKRELRGAKFVGVIRRGKFLLFTLRRSTGRSTFTLLGHLGMTGRMFLQPVNAPVAKHAAVVLALGKLDFVFEDTRYFGRFTLDTGPIKSLGPEPFGDELTPGYFAEALRRSAQPIKVKLLDQSLVAGVGNIYASEALFDARISPRISARRLTREQIERLRRSIRNVLSAAIVFGSTVPLDWSGASRGDGLFYYGQSEGVPGVYEERLQVYDRAGQPCPRCGAPIKRIVQAARSTFFCPRCQCGGSG